MPIEAAPIVVDPSGQFLGSDGAWSSFLINVGNPTQQVHVLASTQVASTWVVAPEGCSASAVANCTQARGGTFDKTKSVSWNTKNIYQLDSENNLGYTGNDVNGTYGFDTLGIIGTSGVANVSVDHQVVADIITNDFYVGNLGLNSQPIKFADQNADTTPSFLSSLKTQNRVPSLSFGYTAGASYRNGGVNASLTLGGYDASRFTPNDVSFQFAPTDQRQLVVGMQSITYSDSQTESPLMTDPILALVDSTVPYLWLPQTACTAFEKAFGITRDPISNLYLVNETLHSTLVKRNPSVIFQLSNSLTGGPSVNITLPYASFDLEADAPLVANKTRYFPLQRGSDSSQYTLGRTFFQEAFVIIDFESSNFSISQSVFDPSTPSHIVAIAATNSTAGSSPNPTSTNIVVTSGNGSHGLATGATAGIAIAIVLIALLGSLAGLFYVRRRRRSQRKPAELPGDSPLVEKPMHIDDIEKEDFSEGDPFSKKMPTVMVNEVPMTPPLSEADAGSYLMPGSPRIPLELPAEQVPRSKLSSPEPPANPSELQTPDAEALRSELSTPEPIYPNYELPTPEISQELPTPDSSTSGAMSPGSDSTHSVPSLILPPSRSALTSPEPRLSMQRPTMLRMDSSESEAGFTRDGMRLFHRSHNSNDSDLPLARHRNTHMNTGDSSDSGVSRPRNSRMDSSESESGFSAVSPTSPVSVRPPLRSTFPQLARPPHHRLESTDSDTWETRLEMSSSENESAAESRVRSAARHQRGVSEGRVETRENLLSEEDER